MTVLVALKACLESLFDDARLCLAHDELTLTLRPDQLLATCSLLRNHPSLAFEQCVDVCGVDYLQYGQSQWQVDDATFCGFDRAVAAMPISDQPWHGGRFAVVYHLLSVQHNHRLRLKVFLNEDMMVPSLIELWPSVNWFEREAFDLYGILFENHPDLRRLLTDYGFIGHPFRKDFPLSGHVEVRYDAKQARVVYEPVSIKPRVLVPKVIRGRE